MTAQQVHNRIDAVEEPSPLADDEGFGRRSLLNRVLMALGLLLTVGSLIVMVPPLLSEELFYDWPWPNAQVIPCAALLVVGVVVIALARERRRHLRLVRVYRDARRDGEEKSKRHTARVYALLNVSRMLGSWSDIQTVFDSVTRLCVEVFNCDYASLMLLDRNTDEFVVRAASGPSLEPGVIGARQKVGEGVAGYAARTGEAMLLHGGDTQEKYPGLKLEKPSIRASMVVPIVVRDELIGVINASSRSSEIEYDRDDLRALQAFAENVGACVRHAEHVDWMRKTIESTKSGAVNRAESLSHSG